MLRIDKCVVHRNMCSGLMRWGAFKAAKQGKLTYGGEVAFEEEVQRGLKQAT